MTTKFNRRMVRWPTDLQAVPGKIAGSVFRLTEPGAMGIAKGIAKKAAAKRQHAPTVVKRPGIARRDIVAPATASMRR